MLIETARCASSSRFLLFVPESMFNSTVRSAAYVSTENKVKPRRGWLEIVRLEIKVRYDNKAVWDRVT